MTELDQALETLKSNPEDPTSQMNFYGLFLNTIFFVPIKKVNYDEEGEGKGVELPLIIENEGSNFLVFFDEQKRLDDWAEKTAPSAQMPGYAIAEITSEEVCWAMNVGTEHDKQFSPEEIAWLKDVIARSKVGA